MNSSSGETSAAYEAMGYPSPVVAHLTPDRIAAAGLLHGWRAPDSQTASVLEVGCGDGLNLIGIAAVWPRTRCVGLDLSEPAIARARALAAAAALDNVEFHAGDILEYPLTGEPFDYITAHGVYTWVPAPVRAALMQLIGARLAPGGVAYLSFDCLPAAAGKGAISRFLRERTAHLADPAAKIRAATELVAILAQHQRPGSRLRADLEQLTSRTNYLAAYFYHDWLAAFYDPISVADFAADARAAGLLVAGDAGLTDLYHSALHAPGRALLVAEPDVARQLETLDLLHGDTQFRRALLVRQGQQPPPDSSGMRVLRFSFIGERTETADGTGVAYSTQSGSAANSSSAEQRLVLDALLAISPAEMTFDELEASAAIPAGELELLLRTLAVSGLITCHTTPQPFVTEPGERPRAGRLVRAMLKDGTKAISLRHIEVSWEDQVARRLLILCDGTRSRAEVAGELEAAFGIAITPEVMDSAFRGLAKAAVFEA